MTDHHDEYEELLAIWEEDPEAFARCFTIADKSTKIVDFNVSPPQRKALHALSNYRRGVILKGRQMWITTIMLIWQLRMCLLQPGSTTVCAMHTDANAVLKAAFAMDLYRGNPILTEMMGVERSNDHRILFDNGSQMLFTTANNEFLRSMPIHFAHFSEARDYDDLGASLASLKLAPNGQCFIESTAGGEDDFHAIWTDPEADYHKLFLCWRDHPEFRSTKPLPEKLLDVEINYIKLHKLNQQEAQWWVWERRSLAPYKRHLMQQENPSCLTADTRVGTNLGVLRMDQLAAAADTAFGQITGYWPKSENQVYRLTTENGYTIRGTDNHPILDPETGEFVPLLQAKQVSLAAPMLASSNYVFRWRPYPSLECSVEIDERFGLWLGMFMGDGSLHNATVELSFDGKDADVADLWDSLSRDLFGVDPCRSQHSPFGWRSRFGSIAVADLLERLGCTKPSGDVQRGMRRVCVPECIWRSPKEVVRAFLRGLAETDGFTSEQKLPPRVVIFSKWPEFIRDVQHLLLCFGIVSRVSVNDKVNSYGRKYIGRALTMTGERAELFAKEIGFIGARKCERARKPEFRSERNRGRRCDRKVNAFVDRVVSIVPDGVERVYDITIKDLERFDANGIVVHNSPDEAFLLSGDRFLKRQVPVPAGDPLDPDERGVVILEPYDPSCQYSAGIDPAPGSSDKGDPTGIVILNVTRKTVAVTQELREPTRAHEHKTRRLLADYGDPITVVETAQEGLGLCDYLRAEGVPMFHMISYSGLNPELLPRHGWRTDVTTRPILWGEIYQASSGEVPTTIKCHRLVKQLNVLQYDKKGKPAAPKNGHDDLVVAFGLACLGASQALPARKTAPSSPKKSLMEQLDESLSKVDTKTADSFDDAYVEQVGDFFI